MIAFYNLIQMVPTEYRDPKKIKSILIDIEKRVEMNPSRSLEEVIRLMIQGLSKKHEATDAKTSWSFTNPTLGVITTLVNKIIIKSIFKWCLKRLETSIRRWCGGAGVTSRLTFTNSLNGEITQ